MDDYKRIVWLDVETTGLSPFKGEKLLQVAAIVTDDKLNEVGNPFMAKVFYSRDEVAQIRASSVEFVQKMHDATNLWSSLPHQGVSLEGIDAALIDFLKERGVEKGSARLGGNSITLDRNFLDAYLPTTAAFLHYRSIDMSSVVGLFQIARPEIALFEKVKTHDALDDIRESLAEARYYRDILANF